MANFCSKCGVKVLEDSIFCDYCGNKLKIPNFSQESVHSISVESPRRSVHSSTLRGSPRRGSPYFYQSYNRSPSHEIKWLFIAFFVVIFGVAFATALVFGFMSLLTFSNEHNQQMSNEVDFNLLDYSLTTYQPGVLEFTTTIRNDGSVPATSGLVPISWEDSFYELQLSGGVGTLDEHVVGFDLNGNGDTLDTFSVTRIYDNTRQWDAIINDGLQEIYAYSIFEGPARDPGSIRTYYIHGQPKLFHLGSQTHSLYMASDDRAWFGLGNAVVENHSGPCFELLVNSRITVAECEINGELASVDYTRTLADYIMSGPWITTAYIIPIPEPGAWPGEQVTFSCTLISNSSKSSDIFLLINWSPDGNTRKLWLPFEQSGVAFEEINQPYFIPVNSTLTQIGTGMKQLTSTIKNLGTPMMVGVVPISWEKMIYDLPLVDGKGTLDENIVDQDLNGDGDKMDSFDVTWFHNETRHWDAIISDGVSDIHAYSLWEEPLETARAYRTYYINGKPKLFQLGSDTHSLYISDSEVAVFGLGDARILSHPCPNFEVVIEHEGVTSSVMTSDFKINNAPVEVNYTWSGLWSSIGYTPWTVQATIVPNQLFKINSGNEVTFSCTLIANQPVICDIYILMNWSPDGNIRPHFIPFMGQRVLFDT